MEDAQGINAAISINELTQLMKDFGIPYKTSSVFIENLLIFIITAVTGLVVVLIIVFRRKKGYIRAKTSHKSIPLEKYLQNIGNKLPFDMALSILEPVILILADMHLKGICHLDICPENITINEKSQKANLTEPRKKNTGGYTVITHPGFSSPEQFKTNGDIGTWTDVYAVGAILYRIVLGKNPPDACTRLEDDTELYKNINERYIEVAKKQAWLLSLNLAIQERIKNCNLLAQELLQTDMKSVSETANVEMPDLATKRETAYERREVTHVIPEKTSKHKNSCLDYLKRKRIRVFLYILVATAVAVGSYFGYLEYSYQKIVEYTEKEEYVQAGKILPNMPLFYKDISDLWNYTYACEQMQNGNLEVAKEIFADLGDYRDAKLKLDEIENNMINTTTEAEDSDTTDDTEESNEFKYQRAIELYNNYEYLKAYNIFNTIKDYKDVSLLLSILKEDIYNLGIKMYKSSTDKFNAKQYFDALSGYKDSNNYIILIESQYGFIDYQAQYEILIKIVNFEDANEIIMSEKYIFYFINGNWSDEKGNYIKMENVNGFWNGNYSFSDIFGDMSNFKQDFKVVFRSLNEISVYSFINKQTYILQRQ